MFGIYGIAHVQLTHMTFILSEPGWAWAGFSHSPIIRFDG